MTRILALAALVLATAWAPVTLAQTVESPASAGSSQPPRDFSDNDLKSFANALVQVSRINDNYIPIYHAARTAEDKEAVEQKASQEMVQAVESSGMSVARYHEILYMARSNPEVANRIHEHVKEAVTR